MPKMSERRRRKKKKAVENGEVVQTENECSGLLSAGGGQKKTERERREKRESIREGSWSIMVSHSGTAAKEKGGRGKVTTRRGQINTRKRDLRRSYSKKREKKKEVWI